MGTYCLACFCVLYLCLFLSPLSDKLLFKVIAMKVFSLAVAERAVQLTNLEHTLL